eukprot:TRINITY_DN8089_c0_g1_i6.p1 TRINITY_DN8089_c0_g1~~TRINITY_DN8089_c0_g1_i6.p1  ORF type:complete len:224 (-),score=44.50 TRINITY_DN8089_c0_g1_i6:595-1266(-)
MALHSRNIAAQAGVPPSLVPEVSAYMVEHGTISIDMAKEYLKAHSILTKAWKEADYKPVNGHVLPSNLLVELNLDTTVSVSVIFETLGDKPIYLKIKEGVPVVPLQHKLFGKGRDAKWFKLIFYFVQKLRVANKALKRSKLSAHNQIKLLSMLINMLLFQLLKEDSYFQSSVTSWSTFTSIPLECFQKSGGTNCLDGFSCRSPHPRRTSCHYFCFSSSLHYEF